VQALWRREDVAQGVRLCEVGAGGSDELMAQATRERVAEVGAVTIPDAPRLPEWVLAHAAYGNRTLSLIDHAARTGRASHNRYSLWLTLNCPFEPGHVIRDRSDIRYCTPSLERAKRAFEAVCERDLLGDGEGRLGAPISVEDGNG